MVLEVVPPGIDPGTQGFLDLLSTINPSIFGSFKGKISHFPNNSAYKLCTPKSFIFNTIFQIDAKIINDKPYKLLERLFGSNNFLFEDNSIIINDTYIINAIDKILQRNKA